MTEVNLNDNIHYVDPLAIGSRYQTQVWISEAAADAMLRELNGKDQRSAVQKVLTFAQGGFFNFEGEEFAPIRHEVGETYRIAYKQSTLFRLIGFYEGGKGEFIIIDAFTKHGRDYRAPEWRRIERVEGIRKARTWQKRQAAS